VLGVAPATAVFTAHGHFGIAAAFTAGLRPALLVAAGLSLHGACATLALCRHTPCRPGPRPPQARRQYRDFMTPFVGILAGSSMIPRSATETSVVGYDTDTVPVKAPLRRMRHRPRRQDLHVLGVKAAANDAALRITDAAMRVCGGAAFSDRLHLDRFFRDARAGHVMAPTADVLYDFYGKAITGQPLF
jgi:hypothetical protein